MTWPGNVAHMKSRNAVFVGNPEGKMPLERLRHRWEDNIKMDLREIWCGGMDCIHLAHSGNQWWAVMDTVVNVHVPQTIGQLLNSLLLCSCFLRPLSLIQFLCSGFGWRLFLKDHPLGAPLATFFLVWFFLMMCPLHRATPAWQVIYLLVVVNFFQNPQFPQVLSSNWLRQPVTRCCFLSPPTGFTAACSLHSRCASVSWQTTVSFRQALREWIAASIFSRCMSILACIFFEWTLSWLGSFPSCLPTLQPSFLSQLSFLFGRHPSFLLWFSGIPYFPFS
jgi:hypothetical protein